MSLQRIAKKIVYSGRVQGVGFRYNVIDCARDLEIFGYVQNLPDGDVELVVEGAPYEVETLLSRVADAMRGYITDFKQTKTAPQGFKDFSIKR